MAGSHLKFLTTGELGTARRQSGAVLFVSLILLLVLTLIGVFAMRGTTMEERMAGNMRDHSMGFETGEAGLRDGEQFMEDQVQPFTDPVFYDDIAYPGGTGRPEYAYHYADRPLTQSTAGVRALEGEGGNNSVFANDGRTLQMALDYDELFDDPMYLVEQQQYTPRCDTPQVPCPEQLPEDDQVFRVLVRAYGGSENALLFLESQFRPFE